MIKSAKHLNRKIVMGLVALFLGVALFGVAVPALAQEQPQPKPVPQCTEEMLKNPNPAKPCIGEPVPNTPDPLANPNATCKKGQTCDAQKILGSSPLVQTYINPLIKTLTAVIGIVVAIALVISGIQYSAAGGDPSKVGEAKKRIMSVIVALLAYLFLAGFMNWLVPGGLF
jgi:hypothetical protein